jgi:hypothetical protein
MKRILGLILAFVALSAIPSHAAILVFSPNGTYTTKPDLTTAATAADAAGKTVVVTSALSAVQSNISSATVHGWPVDRALRVEKGGSIANTTTFRLNGPFSTGDYQVFAGSGTVTGLKEARPEWFGAAGDGTTDDTAAINAAVQATNGWVKFTHGKTYIISPATPMTFASGATFVAFPMKSNMLIDLTGSTLKLKNGYSTDGAPKRGEFFGATTALSNIIIKGGTMDGNGANNKISPSRGSGTYNRYPQSFVIFSTDNGRGSNILLDGVTLQNSAGASPLKFAESNTADILLGQGWTVKNCTFINDASDTDDMSTIYAFAENVLLDGNTFKMTSPPTFGVPTAIEIHGAHTRVVNNHILNFFQGMWQSVNYTNDTHDVLIANNTMVVQQTGIAFEHDISTEKDLYGISIKNNIVELDNTNNRSIQLKTGFTVGALNTIHDINISGNLVKKTGGYIYGSAGIVLQYPSVGQKHTGIVIAGNHFVNTVFGLYANINAGGTYGTVTYDNNQMVNLTPATGYAAPIGATITTVAASPIDYLELKGNSIIDNISPVNALPSTGINITGYVTAIDVEQSSYQNLAGNYTESFTIQPRYRFGVEARGVFSVPPVASLWNIGDRIANNVPTVGQPKAWSQTTYAAGVGAYSTTRANTTGYTLGNWVLWTTGTTVWECTTAGTSAGSAPSISGKNPGDTVVDGSITWTMRSPSKAVWTSEGTL